MKAMMDARIDRDLEQVRTLRVEAVDLLTHFVAETPREAREMPEAMMRLGELRWEIEREALPRALQGVGGAPRRPARPGPGARLQAFA